MFAFVPNSFAKTNNYDEYREQIDFKINKLGYSELKENLLNIIKTMDVPWYMTKYQRCIEQQFELDVKYGVDRKNRKDCSKVTLESPEYRNKRLEIIVDAIILELDNAEDRFGRKWFWSKSDLALAALNMCYFESARWSVRVHKGWKRGDKGSSWGLCQIWSLNRDKYKRWDIVGYDDDKFHWSLERTRRTFYMAYTHLILHQHRCVAGEKFPVDNPKDKSKYSITVNRLARVYAGYGTGKYCSPYHLRPKRKNGKKVKDATGKTVMVPGYEPMRRAKKFWDLRKKTK